MRMWLTGAGGNDVSRRCCKFDDDEERAGEAVAHRCVVMCCSHVSASGIDSRCRAAHSCALWTPHPAQNAVYSTLLTHVVDAPPVPERPGRHPSRFARCGPPPLQAQSVHKQRRALRSSTLWLTVQGPSTALRSTSRGRDAALVTGQTEIVVCDARGAETPLDRAHESTCRLGQKEHG